MSRDFSKDRAICEAAAPYFNLILHKEWAPEDYEAIKEYLSAAPERWPAALDEIERLRAELELRDKWIRQENDLNRRLLIEKNELIRKISKVAHDEVERLQNDCYRLRASLLRLKNHFCEDITSTYEPDFDPESAEVLQDAYNTLLAVSPPGRSVDGDRAVMCRYDHEEQA